MIEIKNLSFAYGKKKVLENFSMTVNPGDRIWLYGESGCGKTTLLRLIEGLETPQSGSVETTGKQAVVFQEDRLLPFKTSLENAEGFDGNTRAAELLEEFGLGEESGKYPSELSGGMARRVALARALARGGEIYILDEPFVGMDEENIRIATEAVNRETRGKTLILVTHNRNEAEALGCELHRL